MTDMPHEEPLFKEPPVMQYVHKELGHFMHHSDSGWFKVYHKDGNMIAHVFGLPEARRIIWQMFLGADKSLYCSEEDFDIVHI